MKWYCLGFLFDHPGPAASRVALIEKQRPDWQRGMVNGIGGKIKTGEDASEAMQREFLEEAGVLIKNWHLFAAMSDESTWRVLCFRAFDKDAFPTERIDVPGKLRTMTDEKLVVVDLNARTQLRCISNIPWLIALALDPGDPGSARPKWVEVRYG